MANLKLGNLGLQIGSTPRITDEGAVNGTTGSFTDRLTTKTPNASGAGFRLPHGTAPSAPQNGDVWSTVSGLWARISGATRSVVVGTGVTEIIALTQAEYDALPSPSATALYLIVEDA